jgi:transposase-like protein
MILAIRRGSSLRRVARRFGVSHMTVHRWCKRAVGMRLSRADLSSRPAGSRRPPNRTAHATERRILAIRRRLQLRSALGEHGATAIHAELLAPGQTSVPSVRTIGRILLRNGVLDGRRRVRRLPPPKGWYLPEVAAGRAEIDSFDTITDLVIRGGEDVTVLNGISLHGGLPGSWPRNKITAKIVVDSLVEHWGAHGRPHYAKFDNDTIFQGAHQWADSFGRVIRLCLQLGVTPVFAPPREPGFQAEVESFNGRWGRLVWQRFRHRDIHGLQVRSDALIAAARQRSCQRIAAAPARRPIPTGFAPNFQVPLQGTVIFLRRTDARGQVECLGHRWHLDINWPHRLVRIEVDLTHEEIRFYKLRRREPACQPLVKTVHYRVPKRRFIDCE